MLRPEIDESFGEAALLGRRRAQPAPAPHITVLGGTAGALRPLACGRPAMEDPLVLARALEDLLPRLVTLLIQAVTLLDRDWSAARPRRQGCRPPRRGAPPFSSRAACAASWRTGSARRAAGPLTGGSPSGATAMPPTARWPTTPRASAPTLSSSKTPAAFGCSTEEYPYATNKGVIGCLAAGEALGEPRVVLEESFHLSYPLVLRHKGAIFMLPEMSAACRVQLYRADPFPDRWLPDAVLLEDCRLADATPVLHEGRWWLFATANEDCGSSWDQLHLFHAPDLLGPWTPHAGNPVLIDAGAARPRRAHVA